MKKDYPSTVRIFTKGFTKPGQSILGVGWATALPDKTYIQMRQAPVAERHGERVNTALANLLAIQDSLKSVISPQNHTPPSKEQRIIVFNDYKTALYYLEKKYTGQTIEVDQEIDEPLENIISHMRNFPNIKIRSAELYTPQDQTYMRLAYNAAVLGIKLPDELKHISKADMQSIPGLTEISV